MKMKILNSQEAKAVNGGSVMAIPLAGFVAAQAYLSAK